MGTIYLSQYQKLCKDFDQLLLNSNTNRVVIANTYLHILREHPDFLKHYQLLFYPLSNWQYLQFNLKKIIRFTAISAIKIFQSIFNHPDNFLNDKPLDILFVSHLTSYQQIGEDNDAYFGDIATQLQAKNVYAGTALINHIKVSTNKKKLSWLNISTPRYILNSALNFVEELKLYMTQITTMIGFRKIKKNISTNKSVLQQATLHLLSSDTANALRIAQQLGQLVSKTKAKCIVLTYEGHAWERVTFDAVRAVNPHIKCIGYQHAAIFKYQHSIRRLLAPNYNPDIILTSGRVSQKQLQGTFNLSDVDVICLGSPKIQALGTLTDDSLQCCLVIPEGFISECLILFSLSLNYARSYPNQSFIWRLHPLLSFDKLKKHNNIFNDLPDNIILSKQSLEEDIAQCDSALYRGSTAVINAINTGLKPIYYRQNADELSIDPIYQHQVGKFIVNNPAELNKAFNQKIDTQTKQSLQDFAQDFYTPLNAKVLVDLIKAL